MDEKVTRYVNQDLAYKSEEQKDNEFKVNVPKLNDFIGELEFALMFLNFKDTPMYFEETEEHSFHLRTFDGAILSTEHLLDKKADLKFLNPFIEDGIHDFNLSLLNNTLNFKLFDFNMGQNQKIKLYQCKKMQALDLRGNPSLVGKKIIQCRQSNLNNNEKWYSYGANYNAIKAALADGTIIEILEPTTIKKGYYIPQSEIKKHYTTKEFLGDTASYMMSLSGALTQYYEWFVYIREDENSIGVKVPVMPESTKEIFTLRDFEPGKKKKAICNFVKEHLRILPNQKMDDEYRKVLVQQHLRGQNKFIWRGMEVNVIPAQYDLNRVKTNKKFINI